MRRPRISPRLIRQPEVDRAVAMAQLAFDERLLAIWAIVTDEFRAEFGFARDAGALDVLARIRARVRTFFGRAPDTRLRGLGELLDRGVRGSLERITGIDTTQLGTVNRREAYVRRNVELITTVDRNVLAAVSEVLTAGVGLAPDALADQLQQRVGVERSRARFWAIDQTLKLHADITQTRHQQAGIERYVWLTSTDERVRDEHAVLSQSEQLWAEPPITNARGDRNHPGQDFRCRCNAYPVLN